MNHFKVGMDNFNYVNYHRKDVGTTINTLTRSTSFDFEQLKPSNLPKERYNHFKLRRRSCTCRYCGEPKLSNKLKLGIFDWFILCNDSNVT